MSQTLPRGIRNNNPLNIRRSASKWRGKLPFPTDPDFEQFATLDYGLRAAFLIIRTYIRRYRIDTPAAIIARWAPATENYTHGYISFVTREANLKPHERIDIKQKNAVCRMVWAMARYENGLEVPFGRIENAYGLAFSNP